MSDITWSYTDYFVRNLFTRGFRLVHPEGVEEKAQWGDGSPEKPFPEGYKSGKWGWDDMAPMMKANGYTLLDCECWVRMEGDNAKHNCWKKEPGARSRLSVSHFC